MLLSTSLLLSLCLLGQAPQAPAKKPRQMELKGTLSSAPIPWAGAKDLRRGASDPFVAGMRNMRITLKPSQSIAAEIRSARASFRVRIVNPRDPGDMGARSQMVNPRNETALFLNLEKKTMEVVVTLETVEQTIDEPYTLILTELDTETFIRERDAAKAKQP